MKAQNLATNAQNTRPSRFRSDVREERGKNVPTLDEIRRRALEMTSTSTSTSGSRRNASSRKSTTGVTTKAQKRNEMGVRKERS